MYPWLKRVEYSLFVQSRGAPAPWGPLRRAMRYPAALLRDWFGGELNVRAMSLAYTTLLSLVPLIAFSISVLKLVGAHANLAALLDGFFLPIGQAAPALTKSVMQFARNMRADVLGTIGLVFLVYAVVTTIHKVEASFNFVWRIARPRSIARRIAEYSSVAIVGPVLLAAAFGVLASANDSPVALWLGGVLPLRWTFSLLGKLVPYLLVTVAFTSMYVLIPNTRVKPSAAIIGGVGAGMLWVLIGRIFATFILYSSQMIAIYTSFAVVLTTLIWVYLSWLILLIGAQLAFYVQNPRYLRLGRALIDLPGSARERAAFTIMYLIGRDHDRGANRWTAGLLADTLDVPGSALDPVLDALQRAGLLITTDRAVLAPGRDTREIALGEVLDAIRESAPDRISIGAPAPPPAEELLRRMESALHAPLAGRSLHDLIAPS